MIPISSQDAILLGALLATCGWLYTGRKARSLARKQHTLNAMLQAQYNTDYRNALQTVRPHMVAKTCPDIVDPANGSREAFRTVLNHFELLSAGIRNGDFDERMVCDTQRATIVTLYETCEQAVFRMRDDRRRQTTYEHLEWLYKRWEKKKPGWPQRFWEWLFNTPVGGKRVDPHA